MTDGSAKVTSIDAVRELRSALKDFEADARDALTLLVLEVRRAVEWIEQDRARYWPEQVRRRSDAVIQARNDLERCQLKYGSEEAPSCYEQKKALERAKRRLRTAEEKVKAVQRWRRVVHQEVGEFDGEIAKMTNYLDSDLPRAVAALERMIRALDKYAGTNLAVEVGAVPVRPAVEADEDGHAAANGEAHGGS